MEVKDLISKLQDLDPELEVLQAYEGGAVELTNITIEEYSDAWMRMKNIPYKQFVLIS